MNPNNIVNKLNERVLKLENQFKSQPKQDDKSSNIINNIYENINIKHGVNEPFEYKPDNPNKSCLYFRSLTQQLYFWNVEMREWQIVSKGDKGNTGLTGMKGNKGEKGDCGTSIHSHFIHYGCIGYNINDMLKFKTVNENEFFVDNINSNISIQQMIDSKWKSISNSICPFYLLFEDELYLIHQDKIEKIQNCYQLGDLLIDTNTGNLYKCINNKFEKQFNIKTNTTNPNTTDLLLGEDLSHSSFVTHIKDNIGNYKIYSVESYLDHNKLTEINKIKILGYCQTGGKKNTYANIMFEGIITLKMKLTIGNKYYLDQYGNVTDKYENCLCYIGTAVHINKLLLKQL